MNARLLPLLATLVIFLVAYAVCYAQYPAMLSTRVIGNLLTDNAFLGIVAVGMTFVIISGGIDLSVVGVANLSAVIAATLLTRFAGADLVGPGAAIWLLLAIAAALGVGALAGLANGILVSRLGPAADPGDARLGACLHRARRGADRRQRGDGLSRYRVGDRQCAALLCAGAADPVRSARA